MPWGEEHRVLKPSTSCYSWSHRRGRGPSGVPESLDLTLPPHRKGVTAQACDLEPSPWEQGGVSGLHPSC